MVGRSAGIIHELFFSNSANRGRELKTHAIGLGNRKIFFGRHLCRSSWLPNPTQVSRVFLAF